MKKQYIQKKKKYLTNTYMREAIDFDIKIIKEDDLYITVKKYNKVSDDFILDFDGKKIKYISNGYYMVELTPINENYNIRFYIDNNKKILDYYIDITLKNGSDFNIPYYIDLYLDIIHYPFTNKVEFCDEDELKEALDSKIISKKDYLLAYKVGKKLLDEIKNNSNKYLNIDVLKYIQL